MPKLYANGLFTPEEYQKALHKTDTDSERLQEILKALERFISINPNAFHVILRALMEEPALKAVGYEMKGE